ncbi:MAG: MMPL family transporter [Polyangiaceae bacterium]|nr:MMPL family transporter [Polyangiaceae bacterium]
MTPAPTPSQRPEDPVHDAPGWLRRAFAAIVARRWLVLALYALVLPPAGWFAARVQQDNAIDRLIAADDADLAQTRELERVFGSGELAVLLAEADDPFAPAVLERLDRIERALQRTPRVEVNSVLSIYRRVKAGFEPTPEQSAALRAFASGTGLFREQGLAGDGFLALALVLDVHSSAERREVLGAVRRVVDEAGGGAPPLRALRQVGQPYVNLYLDDDVQRSSPRYFALFTGFVVALILALYRSARTLAAFLLTLGACVALTMGMIGATGGTLTIVSPMVPMTILVTATATLVYLQSRFVERPEGRGVDEHQVLSLANKWLACTASIFATAVGFAALVVSPIRPIREMGAWVAMGLALTYVVVFTLFPALQKILKTPTAQERKVAAAWFVRLTAALPRFSYRYRWPLVLGSVLLAAAGGASLFGVPGALAPMRLLTDPVDYIDKRSALYEDTKRIEQELPGLSITEVWLKGGVGSVSEPDALRGLDAFHRSLEADPDVGAVVGPTTVLRMMRYVGGAGDAFPADAEALDALAGDLEALAPVDPLLGRFVQRHGLGQTRFTILSKATEHEAFERLAASVRRRWAEAALAHPALKGFELRTAGMAPLQAKVSQSLVPTLVESFELTVAIIFVTFLVVFRSGAARIMAMVPSLFAILVMFGVMRLSGMTLNVATILIASTVLGTSENDQIHFFYHFQEGRRRGDVEAALRHTLLVSGRAIFFATLINAGGFLAFGMADLPPIRQFGILSAVAFALSMIADFTALPAVLWLVLRERPRLDPPREVE